MERLLRFSLGPVQGFIGEARRTRDWWAGSFLLSWLTAAAIRKANESGARILSPFELEPRADARALQACVDPFFRAVCGLGPCEYEATLPNQFRACVPEGFDPSVCRQAVLECWRALASAVWDDLVSKYLVTRSTEAEAIWDGQIGSGDLAFWETVWVLGEAPPDLQKRPDDDWLAMRKRRREPPFLGDSGDGDLCSLMPRFREISGLSRSVSREDQDAFWSGLAGTMEAGSGENLDLRRGERLSAPALVKRLFPRLLRARLEEPDLFGWSPPSAVVWENRLEQEWGLRDPKRALNLRFWPSTAAIAAAAWVQRVGRAIEFDPDAEGKVKELLDALCELGAKSYRLRVAERQSRLHEALIYNGESTLARDPILCRLCALDGKLFYEAEYAGDRLAVDLGLAQERQPVPAGARRKLARAAKALAGLTNGTRFGKPPRFFAILQVDGDEIGKRLEEHGAALSEKLREFNRDAMKLFQRDGAAAPEVLGDVLFSSADELIALMPVEAALPAAARIHAIWNRGQIPVTLSGSVVFASYSTALGWVMSRSRDALKAAKLAGRNALCIDVMRAGGHGPRFITSWQDADVPLLDSFDTVFAIPGSSEHVFASNRFVHDLADRLAMLCRPLPGPGRGAVVYPGGIGNAAHDALGLALRQCGTKEDRERLAAEPELTKHLRRLLAPPLPMRRANVHPAADAFLIMAFLRGCLTEGAPV